MPLDTAPQTDFESLDPFTKGYIEALLHDRRQALEVGRSHPLPLAQVPAFSDLAPETLARIVEDCAKWQACEAAALIGYDGTKQRVFGAGLWEGRQSHNWPAYPPLTAYLGDGGLLRFREAV